MFGLTFFLFAATALGIGISHAGTPNFRATAHNNAALSSRLESSYGNVLLPQKLRPIGKI